MRLIDADELKKKLWSPTETYVTEDIVTEEEIDETPTAYDINEIIEQLEKEKEYQMEKEKEYRKKNSIDKYYRIGVINGLNAAIRIVKGDAE